MQKCIIPLLAFILFLGIGHANGQWTQFLTHNSDADYIHSMVVEGDIVWCATQGGLVKWDTAIGTSVILKQYGTLYSAAIDWEGVKWFGGDRCVYALKDTVCTVFNKSNSPVLEKYPGGVSFITVDSVNKRIICAISWSSIGRITENYYTIASYDGETWEELVSYKQMWGGCSLVVDTANPWNIWGGGLGLYYRFFEKTDQGYVIHNSSQIEGSMETGVYSIALDRAGNLWMSAYNIYFLDRQNNSIIKYTAEETGTANGGGKVIVDQTGITWFGKQESIVRYDNVSWSVFPYTRTTEDDNITAFTVDEHGDVWMGRGGEHGSYWNGYGLWRFHLTPAGVDEESTLPKAISIIGNSPNPFNPSTTISFSAPFYGDTELIIYSSTGQRVRALLSGPLSAGLHSVVWDGHDDSGKPVSSGVYISRLTAGKQTATGKMLLIR